MSENLLMGITVLLHSVVSPLCRKVSASLKKSLTYSTVLLSSSFEQNAGTSLKNLLQDEEQGGMWENTLQWEGCLWKQLVVCSSHIVPIELMKEEEAIIWTQRQYKRYNGNKGERSVVAGDGGSKMSVSVSMTIFNDEISMGKWKAMSTAKKKKVNHTG